MELATRAQLARLTLSLLTIVVSLFFLGLFVIVLCAGLGINPFKETTTSFLITAFMGLIGVAAVLVLLNVATNLSLIADASMSKLAPVAGHSPVKKWAAALCLVAVLMTGLVFGGTYLSKQRFLNVVHSQADEVLKQNNALLEEISARLASGTSEDFKRITEIETFLQSQRSGLPQLTVIYSGEFAKKRVFYQVGQYFGGDWKNEYHPPYFACTANRDCDYLAKFFSGEKSETLEKYTIREDEFYIYVPYAGKQARFVMLFERRNSYGKIGS